MGYADVVLDIPTRALEGAFVYEVPAELDDAAVVGTTVLVHFAGRECVGYVVGRKAEPPEGMDTARIRAIEQVLAPSCFDEVAAGVVLWMAEEYACTLADAVHPFLAPGQKVSVKRSEVGGPWMLVTAQSGAVDQRFVSLTEEGRTYEPPKNASRQRAVLEALAAGQLRMAELSALVSGASSAVRALERKGAVEIRSRRRLRGSEKTTLSSAAAPRPEVLTEGQFEALETIEEARAAASGDVVLIDGVTGSGKTEVYLTAIERTLAQGKGAIVLVPEISLTAQTVGRFRARFGDAVAVLHSRLSAGERFDQWDLVRMGEARVVVGARSALFAPMSDVGLIVIDEEHEFSYKQDSAPRYHAREVAAHLAAVRGCALVLGSATPSFEALERCRRGSFRDVRWTRVAMPERPGTAELPTVKIVDMAAEFTGGGRSIFSRELKDALQATMARGEKAVLLLNRRGFANFLMCRECGCVPECPHCSTALTYHERTHSLVCHTCDRSWQVAAYPNPATSCPNCGSRYLAAFGVGTQRVEDELHLLLGDEIPIIRMDWDTTRTKGAHQQLLEEFDAAERGVLVGTQMIAKGLDFPEVTLVGVINADTMLKLPDFRSAERTYDLLEQVGGRAGRGGRAGEVIVQSWWASHPAIQAAATHDRRPFEAFELAERKEAAYPPFGRLANVIVWGKNRDAVRACIAQLAESLREAVAGRVGWEVLGPADCVRALAKDNHRRHVMVKAPAEAELGSIVGACVSALGKHPGVNVAADIDPYDMM